jgi:hypothetical protein
MISSYYGMKIAPTLVPFLAHTTAEGTGVGVDRQGFGDVLMIAQQGISLDTLAVGLKWVITFEESDVLGSGYTTIAVADIEGGYATWTIDAAAEDPTTIVRRYFGSKRYVRILWTQTGTHTNGTPLAGVVVLGNPNHIPVTQPTETGTGA